MRDLNTSIYVIRFGVLLLFGLSELKLFKTRKKYISIGFPMSYYTTLYVKRFKGYMRFGAMGYPSRDCGVDTIISVVRFGE